MFIKVVMEKKVENRDYRHKDISVISTYRTTTFCQEIVVINEVWSLIMSVEVESREGAELEEGMNLTIRGREGKGDLINAI